MLLLWNSFDEWKGGQTFYRKSPLPQNAENACYWEFPDEILQHWKCFQWNRESAHLLKVDSLIRGSCKPKRPACYDRTYEIYWEFCTFEFLVKKKIISVSLENFSDLWSKILLIVIIICLWYFVMGLGKKYWQTQYTELTHIGAWVKTKN